MGLSPAPSDAREALVRRGWQDLQHSVLLGRPYYISPIIDLRPVLSIWQCRLLHATLLNISLKCVQIFRICGVSSLLRKNNT